MRDEGALEAALARPFMGSFDGDYYPSPTLKATAFLESVVKNHPFLDGNKRTGLVGSIAILYEFGLKFKHGNPEKAFEFLSDLAASEHSFDEIEKWIQIHIEQQ
jgi:death on curing protein